MALFAELEPDPMIRIDEKGIILQTNEAARVIAPENNLEGKNIKDFFPSLPENLTEKINSSKTYHTNLNIHDKYYEVYLKPVSSLHFAQLYFKDLTERNLFEKKLIESRKQLRYLSNHLQESIEDERKRISAELHDSIGQNLLSIKLLLQEKDLAQKSTKISGKVLPALEATINELRRIAYQLKPTILEEVDLHSALISLSNNVIGENEIYGEIDFVGKRERFSNKIEIALYRVVQEALTNIVKHSHASHYSIQMINGNNFVRVLISDDGIGINTKPDPRSHFGLLNIRERIRNLNGTFKIESPDEGGTILMISLPKNDYEILEENNKVNITDDHV